MPLHTFKFSYQANVVILHQIPNQIGSKVALQTIKYSRMKTYVSFLLAISISIASMAKGSSSWPMVSADTISSDDSYNAGCEFYSQGDTVSAAKCFQESAKSGNADGLYVYGLFKMGGFGGVKVNQKAGLRMIKQAAEIGESAALCFLGGLYESGEYGHPVDKAEALNLYKKASEAGSLDGHIACGNTYWENSDTAMAMQYWAKAVEESIPYFVQDEQREALAQITYNLGWYSQYCNYQDLYEATDYYQQSVQYGNTKDAAFQLGLIYLNGASFSESSLELATYYFKMSAAAGKAEAYSYVGDLMRLSGSDEQALLIYLEGAQSGNKDAMYSLAELYYEREEYSSAIYWAGQCPDNVLAVYLLGCTYYMLQDFDYAKYYWQQCVFRFHYADAITMLKNLASVGSEWQGISNGLVDI